MNHLGRSARAWLAVPTAAALLLCAGFVLAPATDGFPGALLRLLYRPACHQIADRCLDLGAGPLAVCARCTGLYLGGLIALMAATLFGWSCRPRPRWLLVVALPSAVDVALGLLGLPSLSNLPRLAVALPLGLICGLYLADGIAESVDRRAPIAPVDRDPVQ
jgi:uncharacterized membrane protein